GRVWGLVPAVTHQPLPEERELLVGELADLTLLATHPGRSEHRPEDPRLRVAVGGRHHVFLDGQVQEQAQSLERARDAAPRDLVWLQAHDALSGEADVPF